jgi:hypothetical protein
MGYRSDVMAIFYTSGHKEPDVEARNRAMLDMFMRENFPEKEVKDTKMIDDDGLHRVEAGNRLVWEFRATSVKWYESYPEVVAFDAFWEKFCQTADGEVEEGSEDEPVLWACEFIRIGENTDDIEERTSSDSEWLMQVSRVIDRNY